VETSFEDILDGWPLEQLSPAVAARFTRDLQFK
jgi:hypothetical protein